jgi:hypothetical protein
MLISPMTVLPFRTSTYARNIYIFGTNRLTARDGFVGIPAEYYTQVEQYAKNNFTTADIQNALAMTWINDQEYNETMAL